MHIDEGARIIVEDWLHIKKGDLVYFIVDETKKREAEAFVRASKKVGANYEVIELCSHEIQAGQAIENLKFKMAQADAVVGATNFSFITTDAVYYALSRGVQFLSMPMSTNDGSSLLEQDFLKMDPDEANRIGMPMFWEMRKANKIHVTTELGTDLYFDITDRFPGIFHGSLWEIGKCSSASFEIYIPPVEYKTSGRLVLDGSMGYIGLVQQPTEIIIENGYISRIEDTKDGIKLLKYIESFHDTEMFCAAEFGIGLNTEAKCQGISYIEDESAFGTFHIGFGRNLALGGCHNATGHFDLVTHNPTITVDDKVIMKNGVAKGIRIDGDRYHHM
ncbi:peptidase [Floccifex sp.]|uniref:peptidase n=1 Tax=Floccifex sp. TaxID=2815810 RepID=UPI002A7669B9|nr:peptidase [Floccifex sp.]MDD7281098.1 peptidase [Erysipelotrichaceae bacterium]MDY2958839.1 peptidase [Floccifex sp.]